MLDHHALPLADPQGQLFRAEWTRRRKRQRYAGIALIFWTTLVVLFVLCLALGAVKIPSGSGMAAVPVYFLPLLLYTLFGMINNRCPRCAKNMSRVPNPRFCFNCGLHLREH